MARKLKSIREFEQYIIVNALRIAADIYHRDADMWIGEMKNERMYQQFCRQADEACELADRIEQAESIELF